MTDKFKIDKGIPLAPRARNGRVEKYPWSKMEVNDSFFVPLAKSTKISNLGVAAAKRHPGAKWTTRTVTENGVRGVRVWRVK